MALREQQTVTPEAKTDHMTRTPFSALSKTKTDQTIFKHISSYFLGRLGRFLPHHGGSGPGVMLRLGGGAGGQRDITSSLLPVEGLILGDDSLLHAVLKHRHEQLDGDKRVDA